MIFNILIILFNFLFPTLIINKWRQKKYGLNEKDIIILKRLFIFHQIISLIFSFYITKYGGDALLYWFISNPKGLNNTWTSYYGTGTTFLQFICYPLVKYLNISFYIGGLLFGILGFLGLAYIYLIVRKFTKNHIILYSYSFFPLLLFLPNLHFWSSGIGKDSIMFFGLMVFLNALFQFKKKFIWGVLALILIYHIRPPMSFFLLASAFIAVFIDSKLQAGYKIALSVLMLSSLALLYNKVLSSVNIDKLDKDSIEQYSTTHIANLSKDSNSGVNTEKYPLPLKIFTFLYRPLFFDINGPLAIVASFEDLLLLWLSLFMIFKLKLYAIFKKAPFQIKTLMLYFIIASVAFSLILSNLGIMLRMKIMVEPALLIFLFWSIVYTKINTPKSKTSDILM